MLGIGERPLAVVAHRVYNRGAVEERQREPLLIVARPVVEAIGLARVAPQGKRPAGAQRIVVHGAKPGVRADTSKPSASEIDEVKGARYLNVRKARFAQGAHIDAVLPGDTPQCFDKGAVHVDRGVQDTVCAVRPSWRVEAAVPRFAEIDGLVAALIESPPRLREGDKRQCARGQIWWRLGMGLYRHFLSGSVLSESVRRLKYILYTSLL